MNSALRVLASAQRSWHIASTNFSIGECSHEYGWRR